MSMSTWVIGLRTVNDPIYKKHLAVLKACDEADIEILPKETTAYFKSEYTDISIAEEVLTVKIPFTEKSEDGTHSYEIKVSEIPQGVETIRFCNSW